MELPLPILELPRLCKSIYQLIQALWITLYAMFLRLCLVQRYRLDHPKHAQLWQLVRYRCYLPMVILQLQEATMLHLEKFKISHMLDSLLALLSSSHMNQGTSLLRIVSYKLRLLNSTKHLLFQLNLKMLVHQTCIPLP